MILESIFLFKLFGSDYPEYSPPYIKRPTYNIQKAPRSYAIPKSRSYEPEPNDVIAKHPYSQLDFKRHSGQF